MAAEYIRTAQHSPLVSTDHLGYQLSTRTSRSQPLEGTTCHCLQLVKPFTCSRQTKWIIQLAWTIHKSSYRFHCRWGKEKGIKKSNDRNSWAVLVMVSGSYLLPQHSQSALFKQEKSTDSTCPILTNSAAYNRLDLQCQLVTNWCL